MTNITNPYLSAKAFAKKKTDIPVVLVCAIFAAATVSATIKMFSQGKTLSGVMGIFLFAALITPVFRILRHAYRRACARRIAGALLPLTYSENPDLAQTVAPSNESRTQLAVNNEGKTNEATKHLKEPLTQGQTAPKDDAQQKQQTKKSKGMKVS